jgi:FimV-like protein
LSSSNIINEPFVDMILEANWASGRVLRDYTLLFDPPSLQKSVPITATPAQVPANATPASPAPTVSPAKATPPATLNQTEKPANQQVTVKSGDTAGALAAVGKPLNVSLDQMLVALLRANPNAFVGENVNRLKAGAILAMPSSDQALATAAAEATQLIAAQSADFNDFRRKLAGNAKQAPVAAADRKASGSIQANVEDKQPAAPSADKLTLSKGGVETAAAEAQIAKERSAQEANNRAAEITKNITELSKLGAASGAALPAPALAIPSLVASAPQAAASSDKKVAAALPVTPAKTGLINELLDAPLAPAGALALLAALAGFGFFKSRQRQTAESSNSSFLQALEPKEPKPPEPAQEAPGLDLDLSLMVPPQPLDARQPEEIEEAQDETPEVDIEPPLVRVAKSHDLETVFDLPDLNLPKFDLGSLALDKETASEKEPAAPLDEHPDAMTTKLELAEEFMAIGDEHGARALIEEVIAEASGAMKIKAQIALSQLQPS